MEEKRVYTEEALDASLSSMGSLLQALVALALLVQFDMYLRPSEVLALEVSHIVGDRRIVGGAGQQDVAAVIAPSL